MTHIYNPPAEAMLRDSLAIVVGEAFAAAPSDREGEPLSLYLVDPTNFSAANSLAQTIRGVSTGQNVVVNTLHLPTAVELRDKADVLASGGTPLISDYSNPHSDEDKRVRFYSSEQCGPFLRHVYSATRQMLGALGVDGVTLAPIGSDRLPNFPSKLDVDIVACLPSRQRYADFIQRLLDGGVFTEPRQDMNGRHRFFYTELLGAPIDLHVSNTTLGSNKLYRQVQQLQTDPDVRSRYRAFKEKSEGLTISDYRAAKAAFRREVGWD